MLVFGMAYLRGRYNGDILSKTLIDGLMCAMMPWFVRDILDFIGYPGTLVTTLLICGCATQ